MIRSSPGAASALAARLVEQVPAQRFVAAGRAELQDVGQVAARASTAAQLARKSSSGNRSRDGRDIAKLMLRGPPRRRGIADAAIAAFQQRRSSPRRRGAAAALAGDEAAAAHLAGDQAFGFQQFVGGGNGGPVQSKQASQFASGWQPLAPGQLAGPDLRRNLLKKLPIERDFGIVP